MGSRPSTPAIGNADRAAGEPFQVAGLTIPNRVVLAPMAGITGSGFRRYMKRYGVGLMFTEMVSAYGIMHGNLRTWDYLKFAEEERPLGVQLFGDRPDVLARAVEEVLSGTRPPDLVDINMGCPARKVVKTGAGAALLREPSRAVALVSAAVRTASAFAVPVTVKVRSGLRSGEDLITDLAPRLQDAGAAALAVHPRSADMHYRGRADHSVTARIVEKLDIQVVGSGDVRGLEDVHHLLRNIGVDAVMVARGVQSDPWLVQRILQGKGDRGSGECRTIYDAAQEARNLFAFVREEMGDERAVRWIRKFMTWYLRPAGVDTQTIEKLRRVEAADDLDLCLEEVQYSA